MARERNAEVGGAATNRLPHDQTGRRNRTSFTKALHSPFDAKACFTIECAGDDLDCLPGNALPEGTRLRVAFRNGKVRPVRGADRKVKGRVISGGDWLMLRKDGLVAFDARITLGASIRDVAPEAGAIAAHQEEEGIEAAEDDFLFNVVVTGVAPSTSRGGPPPDGTLSVVLPAVFEASHKKEPWVAPRLLRIAESNDNYSWFTDCQCLAVGKITFEGGRVVAASYTIYALTPKDDLETEEDDAPEEDEGASADVDSAEGGAEDEPR
jgi:hypothetical protein